jgi:hypothetical protein
VAGGSARRDEQVPLEAVTPDADLVRDLGAD